METASQHQYPGRISGGPRSPGASTLNGRLNDAVNNLAAATARLQRVLDAIQGRPSTEEKVAIAHNPRCMSENIDLLATKLETLSALVAGFEEVA